MHRAKSERRLHLYWRGRRIERRQKSGPPNRGNLPHPAAGSLILDYLALAGHGHDDAGALFRPLHHNREATSIRSLTPDAVYKVIRDYSGRLGFQVVAHSLRATAATNALENEPDLGKVRLWLGHANVSITCIYDHRKLRPEDCPTFKLAY